ncbi:MAG: hypothetical protein AAGC55_11755 [Myxococcota bacterium]
MNRIGAHPAPTNRRLAAAPVALIALAALVMPAGGCSPDDRHIGWERERVVLGPLALKHSVAYIDSARDRAITVDISDDRPRAYTHGIGRRAIYATSTPDRERLAVITRGEEALRQGQIDQDPQLWLIDAQSPDSEPVSYDIGSPFDRLAIAADGHVAVAYFSDSGPDDEGFFRNPNELAVIDLSRPPADDNPVLKTVRSFGSAPDGVVLSPPMVIPGSPDPTPRTFAFVLAPNNVTVLDTTYPDRREVSIRLDLGGATVRPRELVFAPNTATAYLRSDNANDVLEILISDDPPLDGDTNDNDYRPALAELGAGAGPADIAVYDDIAGRRLILAATPGTRELVVIDADTAQFRIVATPDPVDRIMLFPQGEGLVPRLALLASISAPLSRLQVLRLDDITDELVGIDLNQVTVDQPIRDVVAVPGGERAMLVHDDERTVLGLLDVAIGSVSPLQGVGQLDSYDFSPDGSFLIGATSGVERVGFVELGNLHPSDLTLDDTPHRIFAMPDGAIYIDHGDPFGRATIVQSPGAARSESIVLTGFLLADLFTQEF